MQLTEALIVYDIADVRALKKATTRVSPPHAALVHIRNASHVSKCSGARFTYFPNVANLPISQHSRSIITLRCTKHRLPTRLDYAFCARQWAK